MNERPRQVRLRPLIDQALRNNRDLRLRELDERLVLARQIIASHLESLRIFRRRVEAGSTSRLDLPQVETLLQQALALGRQPAQERAIRTNGLVLLVGEPVYFGPPHQL